MQTLQVFLDPGGKGANMASRMTILKGRFRLFRSRLGSIFLFLLGIACVLCVLNLLGTTVFKKDQSADEFEGGGRRLAALPGGEELMMRHGHRRHGKKHPKQEDTDDEPQMCQVPKLSLEADTNKEAYYEMEPLVCSADELFYLDSNSVLHINRTVLKDQKIEKCEYRSIYRSNDKYHMMSSPITRREKFQVKVITDFFQVECYIKGSKKNEMQYMEGGRFDDYQRRKLLSNEDGEDVEIHGNNDPVKGAYRHGDVVHQNAPKLLGTFGLPDLPDNILHEHAKKVQDANRVQDQNRTASDSNPQDKSSPDLAQIKNTLKTQQQSHKLAADQNSVAKNQNDANAPAYDSFDKLDFNEMTENFDYTMHLPDYDQYFAQIYPKDEVLERVKTIKPFPNSTQMNVLMFALDSMSHLSYQRKLPMTYKYLKESMHAVIMDGYNIVGDATTAALLPILTGKTETELPETRVNKEGSHFVDIYPFIWNKYEQSGYVTLFAEDQPTLGTFQLRFNGFEMPPTDHYIRPFWQAALQSNIHDSSPQYCLAGKSEHQITLDYIQDLFVKYPKIPKFAFGFLGELSHADNNPAQYIDKDLMHMIENLKKNGHLDNTLLIIMGDHGARYSKVRYTTQGKLEERLPMMSFAFPPSFKKKYPHLMKNLKVNKDRLTTPFDLHELLKTVLDIRHAETPIKYNDRGISLLKAIPANRTCSSASIDLHWCTCMKYEVLDIEDPKVIGVADFIVNYMNSQISVIEQLCQKLSLRKIREAMIVYPNEKVLKYLKSKDADQRIANFSQTMKLDILHYQLTLETEPNDGWYEVTVQAEVKTGKYEVVSDISRINKYNDQPHCIINTHPDLRKYCACRSKPTQAPARKGQRKARLSRGTHS